MISKCHDKRVPVWGEYNFFGGMYISIYWLPWILDKWISEYIRHDKHITNVYPNKFAVKKNQQIYWRMNICVQKILIYSHIRLFSQVCFGLFWLFSYLVLFWTYIVPFWPNYKHFYQFLGDTEHSNIFAVIDIGQMIIRIYLWV